MNKTEFNLILFAEFTFPELSKINESIYLNPKHVKYYMNYHLEKYDWCIAYLQSHRKLLNQ